MGRMLIHELQNLAMRRRLLPESCSWKENGYRAENRNLDRI